MSEGQKNNPVEDLYAPNWCVTHAIDDLSIYRSIISARECDIIYAIGWSFEVLDEDLSNISDISCYRIISRMVDTGFSHHCDGGGDYYVLASSASCLGENRAVNRR